MTTTQLAHFLPALREHRDRLLSTSTSELFDVDPSRFDRMSIHLEGLLFDYSKNRLDAAAIEHLLELADACNLDVWRKAMFEGERINTTENRAVLHTALRNPGGNAVMVDGNDVMPEIRANRDLVAGFCESVRNGSYQPSGKPVTDVLNIGIGGSDLGPRLAVEALSPFHDGPSVHFVSNVDGADIASTLDGLDPRTTLIIIASKTFTTIETMTNARTAFSWMDRAVGSKAPDHFVAISTNAEATRAFGISDDRTFGFRDWVGGRFSVWSAVGMSVMMSIGPARFDEFLDGASQADKHFLSAGWGENIPVLMALISIWHRNVCEFPAQAILPYDQRLANFPRWLQQLDMESNGKSSDREGHPVSWATSPVVFGEPGTNGQHAFYQMLHQGTNVIPADFLIAARGQNHDLDHQHRLLVANCLAQSQALMTGRSLDKANGEAHFSFSGDRPSNTFLYRELDPKTLGMLLALYEHKTFVQGIFWGVNSFDQWGVELGKELAGKLGPAVEKPMPVDADASTLGLLDWFHKLRKD